MTTDFDTDPAYAWWREARAGKKPTYTEAVPQCGFFAPKISGNRTPVSIFESDGVLLAAIGWQGETEEAQRIWMRCAGSPIDDDLYWQARDMGRWPDIDKLEPPKEEVTSNVAGAAVPVAGDNRPPDDDDARDLADQIANAIKMLDEVLAEGVDKIDGPKADKIANSKDRLAQLSKEADKKRAAEKKPWDDGGKAVQLKWKPVIEKADGGYGRAQDALTAFQKAERARREREAADAARKVEEARRAEDEARRKAEEAGEPVPEPKVIEEPAPAAPVRSGGALSGKVTTLRTTRTYAVVEDWPKLLEAVKDNEEVREVVQRIADRAARGGNPLPGTRVEKEETAV